MQKVYENLQARFMKYDEKNKGFINSAEVESLINESIELQNEQETMFLKEETKASEQFDMDQVYNIYTQVLNVVEMNRMQELVDLFSSLGGQPNKDGFVLRNNVEKIILSEYQLKEKMNHLFQELGDYDFLEFNEFAVFIKYLGISHKNLLATIQRYNSNQ